MSWEIAITAAMVGTAFALLYLGFNLDKEHKFMKLFLLMIGMFLLMANFAYTTDIILANNDTINNSAISSSLVNQSEGMYGTFLYVVILTMTYFMFYLAYKLVTGYKQRRKDEQEE